MPSIKIKNKSTGQWEKLPIFKKDASGGSSNHAELDNLDYEHSGHIGFQPTINDLETIRNGASAGATAVQDNDYVHTDNNYSDAEKQKLNGKADRTEIPDVSNFITNTVNSLINYYLKSETYTKQEVNNLIGQITTVKIQLVQSLPQTGETNIIYLVPKTGQTGDVYNEYIYVSNNWELIGSTEVDLSNIYNKDEVNSLLDGKQELLISGTNIKSLNNETLLGEGNIDIPICNLGAISDYTEDNRLNLNKLKPGIYMLYQNHWRDVLHTEATYKGKTFTLNLEYIDMYSVGPIYLIMKQQITDDLPNGATVADYASLCINTMSSCYVNFIGQHIVLWDNSLSLGGLSQSKIELVDRTQNQIIGGTKTFNSLPECSKTPSTDNQLVNKKYVDDITGNINTALENIINGGV